MKKLKYGLIGAGGIAQAYSQAFAESKCCDLIAIADVRSEAANALAESASARAYTNYKELAENEPEMDAVIIATPPNSHTEIAKYFLERRVPVLCEKPLCLSIADAEMLVDLAQTGGILFAMASKFRYCDDVVKAKGVLASGVLGQVLQFENAFTARVDMSNRWNSQPEISGGGVLMDNGTHSVDIIRYFLGGIESVLAVDAGGVQGLKVDESVKMFAKTVDGVTASVDLTWGINKELPYFISIYATNGTLHVGWRESKYKLNSNSDWTVFGTGYEKVAAFRGKIENFSRAFRGEEELYIQPTDALVSVMVIDAGYRSLRENLWQPVVRKAGSAGSEA